jgi:hypothetical protein
MNHCLDTFHSIRAMKHSIKNENLIRYYKDLIYNKDPLQAYASLMEI